MAKYLIRQPSDGRLWNMDEREALGVAIYAIGCLTEPDLDPDAATTAKVEEAVRVLTRMAGELGA